ncbi:putative F-box/LRR-repeat protein At3g28410 [Zingiber officinale]|uniref:putative F-box/LRR-repeat protein At3g28410 n=1 Tax=Zingiber officinale TaxID=94328 RepID=UPI001C4C929D|nr:putative F-box/LRR-repeat protein At3g28410 [Zingiber officinale]
MDELSNSHRRHLQSELGEEDDYLSNLPDELLRHILSFLPTLDSIRTSVLARRWRHVWTCVPVIDFSDFELEPSIMKRFMASLGAGESVSRLHLTGDSIDNETPVYDSVKYAKSHDARHVSLLRFLFEDCRHPLFDLLFDWPSLESLNLQVIYFTSITLSKCIFRLSNLKTLSLSLPEITIRNEGLAKLLSGCPVLEELLLTVKYHWGELIQIEAPNLLRLTLIPTPWKLQINCQKLEYLRLKPYFNLMYLHVQAPSLISVELYSIWRFRTFAKAVCDVTAVTLTVSAECLPGTTPKFQTRLLDSWYVKAVVQGFPIFHRLLKLKIKMDVADQFSLDTVSDLLRCTPNLQSLVLTECEKRPCCEDLEEWGCSSSRFNGGPFEDLERLLRNTNSEELRSVILKTLSETVPAWVSNEPFEDLERISVNIKSELRSAFMKMLSEGVSAWESSLSRVNEPLKYLEWISVNIKSENIRSAFLKMLSERVSAWDRVAITY